MLISIYLAGIALICVGAHTALGAQLTVTVELEPLLLLFEELPPLQATRQIPVHKIKNSVFIRKYLQKIVNENLA